MKIKSDPAAGQRLRLAALRIVDMARKKGGENSSHAVDMTNDQGALCRRRAVYVVLSHRNPDQVERLVSAILASSPTAAVVVRHDSRHSSPPEICDDRVHVTAHRRRTDWGSWEIVAETLDALRASVKLFDPDLVALLSGQDYPVQNLDQWERDFIDSGGGWVGTATPLTYRARWGRPQGEGNDDLTRYTYRWFRLPHAVGAETTLAARLQWVLWKLGHHLEPAVDFRYLARGRGFHVGFRSPTTPFGPDRPCYKGSQWWAMDSSLLYEVLRRAEMDQRLMATFRRSIIPDESFFPSVLGPLQPPSGPPLTYVEWLAYEDEPRVLLLEDLDEIVSSGSPVCRKVVPGVSDALMDRLDELSATR